jgi:hypothetical protein
MNFSNVWAHAQVARCDAIGSLVLKAWRWLFRGTTAQNNRPISNVSGL